MPKRNDFLSRIAEGKREAQSLGQYFNERCCLDAVIITLNRECGFGRGRIEKFLDAYIETRKEVTELALGDARENGDKEITYAKEKIDRGVRQVMGPEYPAFDERYKMDLRKPLYDGGIVVR